VGDHPAEAFLLGLDVMRENAPETYRQIFDEKLPGPVLTPLSKPADHAHYFGPRSTQADYPTIRKVLADSARHGQRPRWADGGVPGAACVGLHA